MSTAAARAATTILYALQDLAVFLGTFVATVAVGQVAGWGV